MGAGVSGDDLSGQAIGIGGTSQLKSGVSGLVETSTGQQVSGSATCEYPTCCTQKPACEKMKACVTSQTCKG